MIAMAQMLVVDVAAVVLAVACIVRRRRARASHFRRVREILGRPKSPRFGRACHQPLAVVVSYGAPAPAQVVEARRDLRTRAQVLADQARFDVLGLPRQAA